MATKDDRLEYGFSTKFLNKNKSVKNLVDRAIKNKWTMARFTDELKKSAWWKNRSDAAKRWDIVKVENPGQYKRELTNKRGEVKRMSLRLGVTLTHSQANKLAETYLRNGMDDSWLRAAVGNYYKKGTGAWSRGNAGIGGRARMVFREMAKEHGFNLTSSKATSMAKAVAKGVRTIEDYESYFREQARILFPAISSQLVGGATVREVLEPYLAMASEELGLSPSSMSMTASKWQKPVTGKNAMSMDEWLAHIRSNSSYGYDKSDNAQRSASVMAAQLARTMGAM